MTPSIEIGGVHDSHIRRDRYDEIAGPTDPAADLRLGIMHSPEPEVLDRFADDGFDLLLAGHTHGGQICLPGTGALVTNCGIPRSMASGLHRYPADAAMARRPGYVERYLRDARIAVPGPIRGCRGEGRSRPHQFLRDGRRSGRLRQRWVSRFVHYGISRLRPFSQQPRWDVY